MGSGLYLLLGRGQGGAKIGDLGLQVRYGGGIHNSFAAQAFQLNFAAKQLIGKAIKLARMASADAHLAVRANRPRLGALYTLGDFGEIGRALDRVSYGSKKDIRSGVLHMLDGCFNIAEILAFV